MNSQTESMTTDWIQWGVATATLPGQMESGDSYWVQSVSNGIVICVMDGLGHGTQAAAASKAAALALKKYSCDSPPALINYCHEALKGTRGVAMSVAFFHALEKTVTWLGIGNVEGLLVRGDSSMMPVQETMLSRGGVVGYQLPPLVTSVFPVHSGDTLIFATDGIQPSFDQAFIRTDSPKRNAQRILAKYSKGDDDALVLIAQYRGK